MNNTSVIIPLVTHGYNERGFWGMAECVPIQKYKNLVVLIYFR